jgi:hypothetical protein
MSEPAELESDALKIALNAVDALLKFRAYMPGVLFVILLGKFRDDLCADLGLDTQATLQHKTLRLSLDGLDSIEIGTVGGAVIILRQPRFTRLMDDPLLPQMLEAFEEDVSQEKHERTTSQAKTRAESRAS